MERNTRVYVTEPSSFVGRALTEALARGGYRNVVREPSGGIDLGDQAAVDSFFANEKPETVFLAAGPTAGIGGNLKRPADLMRRNLLAACHVMDSARRHGARKLLYLASSCVYPAGCPQPMREEHLFTGPLEPTSEAYAAARLAGVVMCQAFRKQYGSDFFSVIPADLFGPWDDFSLEDSHVVAGLMARFYVAHHEGRDQVEVWGSGSPVRDLLYVGDLAEACVLLMERYEGPGPVNVGSGTGTSVRRLAEMVRDLTHPKADLRFDISRPDGAPEKVLDISRIRELGWTARTGLAAGLELTFRWFSSAMATGREDRR